MNTRASQHNGLICPVCTISMKKLGVILYCTRAKLGQGFSPLFSSLASDPSNLDADQTACGLSVFLPLCKSDFPKSRGTAAFSPSSTCLPSSLSPLPEPPARPPGPFQSISNLKFYETKLKLTSHLERRTPLRTVMGPKDLPHRSSLDPFLSPSLI